MNRKASLWWGKIVLIVTGLGVTNLLLAQGNIIHSPPRNYLPGQEIEIEAVVEGVSDNVREVRLLYKPANQSGFAESEMEFRYGYYYGTIPSDFATESGIKYAIVAELVTGQLIAYPENDPYENPVFVPASGQSASPKEDTQSTATRERIYSDDYNVQGEDLILSPAPNSSVAQEEVLVAVTLYTLPNVDPNTIKLIVDGNNVTKQADVSAELVTFRSKQLRTGMHTVQMQFQDVAGRAFEPLKWQFRVAGQEEAERAQLDMRGRMYVETHRSDIQNQVENINKFSGDVRGSYGFLNFNSNVYFTSKEDPATQPRNRYTLGLNSSIMRLQFGDSYPRLSRLGMWGKRVRGVNGQLLLKYVNLHVVYGYSERAIQGTAFRDSTIARIDTTAQDTSYTAFSNLTGYTFPRRVFAIRPSFGGGKNFQLGFSLISSRDDTTQIETKINDLGIASDSVAWNGIKPKDNIVVGTDLLVAFDRQRFVWESSASLSWQNDNIFGGALKQEDTLEFGSEFSIPVSDFPINPADIQNFFIINSNVSPFLPIPATVDTSLELTLHPGKIQDYSSLAYQTKVSLNYFKNYLSFQYKRVGAGYNSFANPYLRKDIAGVEVSDRIRLFQNKVYLTLKYENLDEGLSREEQSQITSNNASTGLSIYPGGNFPIINFNFNQYNRTNGVNEIFTRIDTTVNISDGTMTFDTTFVDSRVDNTTMSNNINISQPLYFFGINHDLALNYLKSFKIDNFSRRTEYPDISYSMNMLSLTFQSKYQFPLLTRLSYSYNDNTSAGRVTRFQIVSAGGQYRMFDNDLTLNGNIRFTQASGANKFIRTGAESTVRYRFLENHYARLNLRFSQTSETLEDNTKDNYTNLVYSLRYTYQF